ncbi:hypothetical protein POL68_17335 [Stigmatella sp. ncwal1]|uniref:Lipoprotein n=1 Tax=Stigmatella ashevillensis TaxID=2995309 RepID=A0ABT5DB18_9BACT|nr:hypothetical protein [Stigmatella ashevillena]MDC0710244.1 hypothetical protein [Stigmatella ashevillena]
MRRRSMVALTVCSLLFGCGSAPEDGEPIEENASPGMEAAPQQEDFGTVSEFKVYVSSHAGAYVTFNSYGDHFVIQDTASDGHSALVQIDAANLSECWNNNGAGTTVDCNRNFTEGINIRFRACVGEYTTKNVIGCSAWKTANTTN